MTKKEKSLAVVALLDEHDIIKAEREKLVELLYVGKTNVGKINRRIRKLDAEDDLIRERIACLV